VRTPRAPADAVEGLAQFIWRGVGGDYDVQPSLDLDGAVAPRGSDTISATPGWTAAAPKET
jgi:hypothetical protein